jgi:hypothetical protein
MVIVKNLYLDYIFPHTECLCLLRGSYFHHPGDDDDEVVIFREDNDDDDEGYIFADQCTYVNFYYDAKAYINTHVLVVVFQKISDDETDEDIEIDGTQDESTATDVPDPYDKVYSNLPEETHMLKLVPDCGYCTAKKFEYEPPGFCCRGGKVELAPLETPPSSGGCGIVQTLMLSTFVITLDF